MSDKSGRTFNASLNSSNSSLEEVQEFFNLLLEEEDFACIRDLSLPSLESLGPSDLLVIVGDLCDFGGAEGRRQAERIENELLPYLPGRQILLLGCANAVPNFVSYIHVDFFRLSSFLPSTCSFVSAFLGTRLNGCIKNASDIVFLPSDPVEMLAYDRGILEFPGLCPITSCCIGGSCSPFVTGGFTVTCRIPLMEPGVYNVSVIFEPGQERVTRPCMASLSKHAAFHRQTALLKGIHTYIYICIRNFFK